MKSHVDMYGVLKMLERRDKAGNVGRSDRGIQAAHVGGLRIWNEIRCGELSRYGKSIDVYSRGRKTQVQIVQMDTFWGGCGF